MDAVLVLANLMDVNGHLNPESAARAALAADAYRRTGAGYILTCGWAYRDDTPLTIADAFRTHIVEQFGLPADQVRTETNSRDTVGDAVFSRLDRAIPEGWKQIVVVTSDYHVPRTREIFDFVYGDAVNVSVVGSEADWTEELNEHETDSTAAFRATFAGVKRGDVDAIALRMRESHPFYNGTVRWGSRAAGDGA